MNTPIFYEENFIKNADIAFNRLWTELAWVQMEDSPRLEYYCNRVDTPYTYGRGRGVRTYQRQPWHEMILEIQTYLEGYTSQIFEVCFCNGYANAQKQLGWHADDSDNMDDTRPIGIISLGSEREIWFRDNATQEIEKLKLKHGSLCLMSAGMQDTHQHRIPKASYECGPRVSLTFRGYVEPVK